MPACLGCIVEGHGEIRALPELLRRLVTTLVPNQFVQILPPIRIPRNRLLKEGELERAVELVLMRAGHGGAVMIIIDSDDDCPATLAPELLRRATVRPGLAVSVVMAKREFESWFLAAAESLRGRRDLPLDLAAPSDPEAVRGAKEWLTEHMPTGRRYVETLDQPALAAVMDLSAARRARSFDKLVRDTERLLGRLLQADGR